MSVAPVSAAIPCYRCADTVGRAVNSVAAQTERPAELFLVDDGNGDGTLEALRALAARHWDWIKVIVQPVNRCAPMREVPAGRRCASLTLHSLTPTTPGTRARSRSSTAA